MHRLARVLALLAIAGALTLGPAIPASAACHEFRFDRDAYTVAESAGSITITVSRDAGLAPSSIGYETRDGTAKAGQDYTARSGRLEYSTQISLSFSVPVTNDSLDESNETFQVHLHDPSGCAPMPNFDVDDPSTVTIQDDDAAPPPPPPHPPPPASTTPTATTLAPSPTASGTTPSPTSSTTPTASPPTGSPSAERETTGPVAGGQPASGEGGGAGRGLAAVAAALLAVSVGGALVARRRSRI